MPCAVAAVACAVLSGCAAVASRPPEPLPADTVPACWAGAARDCARADAAPGQADLGAWWLLFDDALLTQLVQRSLQGNTSLLSAQAALRQAQALREVAAAALWPTLGGSASASRGQAGGHSTGSQLQWGLSAQWLPDVFGGRRSAEQAAAASAEAAAARALDVQQSLAAELALNYIVLRTAQARLAIAGTNLALQEETLQLTSWRQQAGLVTLLEVEQARAATEQTRAVLPALQTGIAQSGHALAVLTGQPPASLNLPLAAAGRVPQVDAAIAAGVPAEALRQRADVRAAEREVDAARARVGQAQAQRWPSFALGGTLGGSAATLAALGNTAGVVASVVASVAVPVLDGGAAQAQVQAQDAALAQAHQAYRGAVLAALKDAEDAMAALRGDRLRAQSLGLAAEAATAAALLARQRYDSGLVDFQTVLDTQRSQLATQDSQASARGDLGADQVRLFRALGGGWLGPVPADAPRQDARPAMQPVAANEPLPKR